MSSIPSLSLRILISLISMLAIACTSMSIQIPHPVVEPPELAGNENLDFSLTGEGASRFHFTHDASARPPNLTNASLDEGDIVARTGMAYETSKNFRAAIFLQGAGILGLSAQYQFLGESALTSKAGENSMSVFGRTGNGEVVNGGNQKDLFGEGGYPWHAYTRLNFWDAGISYGYKIKDETLLYGGYAFGDFTVAGRIEQDASTDGTSPAAKYVFDSQSGTAQTISLGVRSGRESRVDFQLRSTTIKVAQLSSIENSGSITWAFTLDGYKKKPDLATEAMKPTSKETWQGRDVGALACAYLAGFGCGQKLQDRWPEKGVYFTFADSAALAILVSSLNKEGSGSNLGAAVGTLLISRIWQIVDVIIDANSTH